MELNGQKVLVIGLAKSGIGAAALCAKAGALVSVSDGKAAEALAEQLESLKSQGVTADQMILGRAPSDEEAASFVLLFLRTGTLFYHLQKVYT